MKIIESVDKFGMANIFDIIWSFPKDYEVWNIGDNFSQTEYIPLCKVLRDFQIDITSLKALYVGKEAANIIKAKAQRKPFKYKDFVELVINNPGLVKDAGLNNRFDEDYVEFNTAQILIEIGYNYNTDKVFMIMDDDELNLKKGYLISLETCNLFDINPRDYIIAPDIYHACKWLRVKYNLFIEIHYDKENGKFFFDVIDDLDLFAINHNIDLIYSNTYEDAVNKAICYCCELIKYN